MEREKTYNYLIEKLNGLSITDLGSDKFTDFWEDIIIGFKYLSDEERKVIIQMIKTKFELETSDKHDIIL